MPESVAQFLPLILIVVVFWLLIIRPARKRQRDMRNLQSSVAEGTEVMLGSGIYGEVVGLDTDDVWLEIAPETTIRVTRQAVTKVVEPREPATREEPEERSDSRAAERTDVVDEQ